MRWWDATNPPPSSCAGPGGVAGPGHGGPTLGSGDRDPAWIGDVLEARDRAAAGPTAPPQALYFAGVEYPRQFGLPCAPPGSGRLLAGSPGDPP